MQGILTFWSKERGFGFVQNEKRETFFLHLTNIVAGALVPTVGSLVEFDVAAALEGKKSPNAVNAKLRLATDVLSGVSPLQGGAK